VPPKAAGVEVCTICKQPPALRATPFHGRGLFSPCHLFGCWHCSKEGALAASAGFDTNGKPFPVLMIPIKAIFMLG